MVQVLRNQTQLDTNVKDLGQAMANLFSWVQETEALDHKLQHFRETIGLMAKQATECALFIKNYANRGFLGTCSSLNGG